MPGSPSYRFAARPKWIAGHLLALVAIVGFINLGFWQLSRHAERSDVNAIISERFAEPPAILSDLIGSYGEDADALEFRRVRISGSYLIDEEVLWRARTLNGRSGHDVLTPLAVGGRVLIVDRGWVPIDATDPPVVGAEPVAVDVVVSGIIRPGQVRQGLGPIDPETGELDRIARVDIERLQQQLDLDLYPFYVLLEEQSPAQSSGLPAIQDPPSPDSGPHLSYAIQWFVFSTIAAVGYPILLRRTARDEENLR